MSRKKRQLQGILDNAPVTSNRSAYVAVIREMIWCEKNPPQSLYGRQLLHASRVLLTHPDLRVVKFPALQAAAFLDYGADLLDASVGARPPFGYTFYDFGFVRIDNYELAGAAAYWDEDHPWSAIGYMRLAGTNDWSEAFIGADTIANRTGGFRGEVLGPSQDRPPHGDESEMYAYVMAGALIFLESANVDLVEAVPLPKGHRAFGIPHHEVVVRQQKRRLLYPADHEPDSPDWSHRWEVRGHFKHFRRGATFEKNSDRRIVLPDGDEFVRIWCPPHVKGPEDKPLIPKLRKVAA